jgi:hypothetical protein
MKFRLLLLCFFLLSFSLFGQNACKANGTDCACPKQGWCKLWPPSGYVPSAADMRSNGWTSLLSDPDHQQFYIFGMDNGLVTFANAWWAMPWRNWPALQKPVSEKQVWTFLSDCGTGTLARRAIHGEHFTLTQALSASASDSMEIGLDGSLQRPFSQEGTVVLQDPAGEAVHYRSCDQADAHGQVITKGNCPAGSRRLLLRHLTRGYLSEAGYSETGQNHSAGVVVYEACPAPRNMNGPILAHPSDQHPVRDSAYDSVRKRIWNFGGYNEVYSLRQTWYMPVEGKDAYHWFRFLTPTLQPAEAESGGIYDPVHDVILRYGGIYTPTALWLLCFGKKLEIGCSRGNDWNQVEGAHGALPGSRFGYSLAWDSRSNRVLIYGGDRSNPTAGLVYSYDVGTKTWTRLSSANETGPPRQKFPAIAFDPVRGAEGSLLLYAAEGGLYQFDLATKSWTKRADIPSAAPAGPGRCETPNACYLAYDSAHDQFIYLNKPGVPGVWVLPGATLSAPAPHAASAGNPTFR